MARKRYNYVFAFNFDGLLQEYSDYSALAMPWGGGY